jgi:hypothetical protein
MLSEIILGICWKDRHKDYKKAIQTYGENMAAHTVFAQLFFLPCESAFSSPDWYVAGDSMWVSGVAIETPLLPALPTLPEPNAIAPFSDSGTHTLTHSLTLTHNMFIAPLRILSLLILTFVQHPLPRQLRICRLLMISIPPLKGHRVLARYVYFVKMWASV